jgi:hypothetical protein
VDKEEDENLETQVQKSRGHLNFFLDSGSSLLVDQII